MIDFESYELGDLLGVLLDHRGRTPKKLGGSFVKKGVPVISAKNVKGGRVNFDRGIRFITPEMYDCWMPEKLDAGDVLVTSEAPLGEVAYLRTHENICIGQRLYALRARPELLDGRFLYYILSSKTIQDRLNARATGTTAQGIRQSELVKVRMEIPPLEIQQKVTYLLSAYDDLIENNRRRIEILEEMARAIYREWFVHFRFPGHEDVEMVDSELGEIPEGWKVVSFTEMADVLSGGTPRTKREEYWNGQIPFFTPRDIQDSLYILETERHITELGLENCRSEAYPKDTVFITARGTVGRVVMPAVPMAMSQTSYALKGKHCIGQPFVLYKTLECVQKLRKMTHGAVFDTIIIDTFRALKISLPPLALIEAFCTRIVPFLDLILNLMKQKSVLQSTRDLLLPRLVSGEIDVSNLDLPQATTRKTPKYEEHPTLDKWLDGDDQDGDED